MQEIQNHRWGEAISRDYKGFRVKSETSLSKTHCNSRLSGSIVNFRLFFRRSTTVQFHQIYQRMRRGGYQERTQYNEKEMSCLYQAHTLSLIFPGVFSTSFRKNFFFLLYILCYVPLAPSFCKYISGIKRPPNLHRQFVSSPPSDHHQLLPLG